MAKTIKDVTSAITERLQNALELISVELEGSSDHLLESRQAYALVKNIFWDKWLQKLIAQLISIKLWALVIVTGLLIAGFITGGEFAVCFSIVMGAKGIKDVASRLRDTRSIDTIDKT